jgi:hypothetical protein
VVDSPGIAYSTGGELVARSGRWLDVAFTLEKAPGPSCSSESRGNGARPGGVGTRRRLGTEGEGNDAGVNTGWTDMFLHRHCCGRQKGHQICDVTKYGVLALGPCACLIKDAGGGNSLEDVSPSDA